MTPAQPPPFTCRFCGQPSWVEPIDQSSPPDYCHESDHGYPDDEETTEQNNGH